MRAEATKNAEGWNIGSTTVKRVRLQRSGEPLVEILRHRGDVVGAARRLRGEGGGGPEHAVVTGGFASPLADLPYLPEPICVEAALGALRVDADMVISLGGEAFVLHCLHGGQVKRTVAARKCSAGGGEFLVQQLSRMGLDLDSGQDAAERGRSIPIASRCSVHTKSDATHKLNKGECSPGDVARSLIDILARKAQELVDTASWPVTRVVLSGGLTRVRLLVQRIRALLPASTVLVLEQSEYLEAYGAACLARDGATPRAALATTPADQKRFGTHPPLRAHAGLVRRVIDPESSPFREAMPVILGVDAGSTATKAALVNADTGKLVLGCSVRTHGNPVQATKSCIARLRRMLAGRTVRVVQVSATGSGRQVVSMSLGNCDAFNEILAHARAARSLHPDVDTVFEIGGQDAKFIRLRDGIPIDYAMNDGCSAGTGSFLEESAASDLNTALEQLASLACRAAAPVDFGERCAAFINSEIRSALLSGRSKEDVAAGLIYAVVDNYVSKVVRSRQVGSVIVFQGGVALNEAAGLAIAGRTGSRVVIPPRPELMGSLGTALMSRDLLRDGKAPERDLDLHAFDAVSTGSKPPFVCNACERSCSVQRVTVGERTYPFGGLCSRWDEVRRRKRGRTGKNLVAVRHELMLGEFGPVQPSAPLATVGLPLALTTYELFPFYTRLLTGLGFEVVVSRTKDLDLRTQAAKCYPIEILHGAVADLLERGVAHIFLPYVGELEPNGSHESSYLCASAVTAPAVVRSFFGGDAARFLTPEINLSRRRRAATLQQVVELAARFGVEERTAVQAFREAIAHQERFRRECRRIGAELLATAERPVIILVGRPYLAYARAANLGIDQKIASHGYPVIPADMLPLEGAPSPHNRFHYTQDAAAAAEWASRNPGSYICHLSCFSCIPDAVFQHRLVRDLAGQTFCSLEIDSHTADAGLETRIEAFLAIVRERHGARAAQAAPAREERGPVVARRGRSYVIRSGDGREYRLDDPRVKHVMLWVGPELSARLVERLCTRLGWNVKAMGTTEDEVLRLARSVCSGRECLSFRTIVGKMVKHLRERDPSEITVFHVLDKESACQNASWHDALPVLLEQMGATNAVCTFPTLRNGYLGLGSRVGLYFASACIVGDILHEAGSTLRVLAADREHALEQLARAHDRLVAAAARGLRALEAELLSAAERLGSVPLAGSVSGAPKVLIAGGISRVYSEPYVREFLERRGILVKLEEIAEFLYHFVVQVEVTRPHFHQGYASPREQFAWRTVVTGLARSGLAEGIHTLKARVECAAIDALIRRWRRVFAASGLLFERAVPLEELNFNSHHLVSHNTFTEATTTLGRFLLATQGGVYDGVVNLGSFCCAETHISEALLEPHVNGSGMACATLAVEDVSLSAPDELKLETLAAQCWRIREAPAVLRRSPAAARRHKVLTTSLEGA